MMNKHINDTQIQQYVLDKAALERTVLLHMETCEHCRLKAGHYKQIIAGLAQQSISFDFDAALLVPLEIKQAKIKVPRFYWPGVMVISLIGFGLLILAAGAYTLRQDMGGLLKDSDVSIGYVLPSIAIIFLLSSILDQYRLYRSKLKHIRV